MATFMPPSAIIHYKSAFDIDLTSEDTFNDVRNVILNWCKGRRDIDVLGRRELSGHWFFLGDTERHICGECCIRVATNAGRFSRTNPEHWILELIHGDNETPARMWSVNISLTRREKQIRFACLLRYAIKTDYIGPVLADPVPSVPRFMDDIIRCDAFLCSRNGFHLNYRTHNVGIYGGEWMAKTVCDASRRLPVIIAVLNKDGNFPLDTDVLFRRNIGNTNLYTISDQRELNEFNRNVPFDHRLSNGMLRIYQRYSASQDTGYKHRFYKDDQIDSRQGIVTNEITFALSRNANNFSTDEILEIRQVIDRRRLYDIEAMRNSDTRNDPEYIKMLEDEVQEKIVELSRKNEENLNLRIDLEETQERERELTWKASQYAICIEKIASLEGQLQNTQKAFDIPQSLTDALTLASSIYGDKLVIHEGAERSARTYHANTEVKIIREAWKMLTYLANTMHLLKFIDCCIDLEAEFIRKSGIQFSMTESSMTKKNRKFTKIRECTYKGNTVEFFPHLKSSVRDDFRIHFSFLEDTQQLIICHCGAHLDNARTRHMD